MDFSASSIIASLMFGTFGLIAIKQGKNKSNVTLVVTGIALMGYTYIMPSQIMIWLVGASLTFFAYKMH